MIKPKALKKGDTIGLIGPSGVVRTENGVERAVNKLESMGFHVRLGESASAVYGYLSGTDEVRARDVNRMFLDPDVDAVFCIKGGYGTPRILDLLDYEAVQKNPKLFIGYSDITAMHNAFQKLCGLVTFHGPMPASDMIFEDYYTDFTHRSFWDAITSTQPLGQLKNPEGMGIQCLVPGTATGPICGGNLTLIASSLGTPYELDTRGKILLLEDVGEKTYRVDHMLTHLRLAGKFRDCAGVILSDFTDCPVEYEDYGLTLEQIFQDVIVPAGKPTITGFKAGHDANKITVPLGVPCRLDADAGTVTLLEAALM